MALLAEYAFDEGSGSTAADSSGNGRDLTGVPGWGTGHTGSGMVTDGEAGPSSMSRDGNTAAYTLMAWVKFSSWGDWQSIFEQPGDTIYVEVNSSGVLDVYAGNNNVIYGPQLALNVWHHIAFTGDSSASELFVDGVSVGTGPDVKPLSGLGISIGGSADQHGSMTVDDVRWMDEVLTDASGWMNWPAGTGTEPADTNSGSASATIEWTSAATGSAPALPAHSGSASSSISWQTTAVGSAPAVGAHSGSASASLSWTTTAVGRTAMSGSAMQTVEWATTATGRNSKASFLTSINPTGRYFLDQSGAPFLLRGDSPWAAFTNLSVTEWQTYLANRAGYGINTALLSMIGSTDNGGPSDDGATYDGIKPFVGGDITKPNEAYWARVDGFVAAAQAAGITLMIYAMDGWNTYTNCVFSGKSTADCQAYGAFIGSRYANYPNIIWAFGGDYIPITNDGADPSTIDSQFNSCLTGIRSTGDTRPCTIQMIYPRSLSSEYTPQGSGTIRQNTYWQQRVDFNFGYEYLPPYEVIRHGWTVQWDTTTGKPATRPVILGEADYDPDADPAMIRRQTGGALTSGAAGAFTGTDHVWDMQSDWASWLDRPGIAGKQHIEDAITGLDWWTLQPDDNLVTNAGTQYVYSAGDTQQTNPADSSDYITAASSPDGSLAVIYAPNASSGITVDDSGLGTTDRSATWIDPTTGTQTPTTWAGSYANPGTNSAGSKDWLLVLQAAPVVSSGGATGTLVWDTTADGRRDATGQATTGLSWTDTATGARGSDGAAITGWTITTAATGTAQHTGTASADIGWAAAATGTAPTLGQRTGTAATGLDWGIDTTGTTTRSGHGATATWWAATAAGRAPTVGERHGTATATVLWTDAATGTTTRVGHATTPADWTLAAAGLTDRSGHATGTLTWAMAAAGRSTPRITPAARTVTIGGERRIVTVNTEARILKASSR